MLQGSQKPAPHEAGARGAAGKQVTVPLNGATRAGLLKCRGFGATVPPPAHHVTQASVLTSLGPSARQFNAGMILNFAVGAELIETEQVPSCGRGKQSGCRGAPGSDPVCVCPRPQGTLPDTGLHGSAHRQVRRPHRPRRVGTYSALVVGGLFGYFHFPVPGRGLGVAQRVAPLGWMATFLALMRHGAPSSPRRCCWKQHNPEGPGKWVGFPLLLIYGKVGLNHLSPKG